MLIDPAVQSDCPAVITGLLWAVAESAQRVAIGRAAAFSRTDVSWLVGFVGMSLAVRKPAVAAAARTSYGAALQLELQARSPACSPAWGAGHAHLHGLW